MQSYQSSLPRRLPRSLKRFSIFKPAQNHTMAFFPRHCYNREASFTPLFRLLDEFDSYSRGSTQTRRSTVPSWQPKFDVRETGEHYELHGELPGVDKENVQIDFTEPQTLVVRGRTERSYATGAAPSDELEDAPTPDSTTESGEVPHGSPHQATVEDEGDSAYEVVEKAQQQQTTKKPQEVAKKPADTAKYWLSERSIGEFSRTFSFPSRIDQDAVTASFKDGILSVTVPKAKPHESRRIAII
ncbi:hypothetical protein JDV02_001581 [Purpureocillium takamizusanense]|uniref:SHSP domain-containing protein n=1 Tax=Purpureocillium takamizusanense TaxID=2060973 RepID=A0A9Q8V7Z2_9HYPO|nr:uncharacterized protein JDV02_001581 [Purpureocillium takamizusanense]UNI15006.1 hypothetical protein JDV02_001581 [Purpureocillium takamizusanense]